MKTKLIMVGLVMALGGWMAVGQKVHPHVRSLEQRVADLEQMVLAQSQRLDAHTEQAGTQQSQLERIVPIVDEMEVMTWSDGSKTIRMRTCDLWVEGSFSQFNSLSVVGDIYMFGEIYKY